MHILFSGYVKNIYKETDKILVIHAQEYPTIPAAPYPCKYFIKRKRTLEEKAKNSGIYSRWPGAHAAEKTEKMDLIVFPNPTMSTQPHLLNLLTLEVFVR